MLHALKFILLNNFQITANIVLNQPNSTTSSYIATLDKIRGLIDFKPLPLNETRISVLGNLLMSEGKPGKVIKVYVQKRIGKDDFITSMRMGLEKRYSDKLVGELQYKNYSFLKNYNSIN